MRRFQIPAIFLWIFLLVAGGCKVKDIVRFKTLPETPIPEIKEELRGIWVTRFDWVDADPELCKDRIKRIFKNIEDTRFNAVFFQVRGQAETLYPSPFEPWSVLFDYRDPGFDPLNLAIEEAHKYGLKFYAYVNLLPLWGSEQPPADSSHLYFKHGPGAMPDDSWVCYDVTGNPMALNEYYYLNPALPAVKSYLKKVVVHLVSNYDLDGIHFDRIRYPGPEYLYDPWSVKHFLSDSTSFGWSRPEWARQQLTDLVEDVVAEALLYKPYLSVSAATWGLYRTDDIKNYTHFRSGYEHYYQDAIAWLDRGIMDFIVPMIYWDIYDPTPNFHELWSDFKVRSDESRNIFPGLIVRDGWLRDGETASQIHFIRKNTGFGHVLFSYRAIEGPGSDILKNILYPNKVPVPDHLYRRPANQVFSISFPAAFFPDGENVIASVKGIHRYHLPDQDGKVDFIFPMKPDTLKILAGGQSYSLVTDDWAPPFRFFLDENNRISKSKPLIEYRGSLARTVSNPVYYPLFKTAYPAFVEINNTAVKVYKTGVFFDEISLKEGPNRIRAGVISKDTLSTFYEHEIVYEKPTPGKSLPLWIDEQSIAPSADHTLLPGDVVRIQFNGSRGQAASLVLKPGGREIKFSRYDFNDYSSYQTDLPFRILNPGITATIRLHSPGQNSALEIPVNAKLNVLNSDGFPMIKTSQRNAPLEYSLGPIRLGSPVIAEYDTGIVMKVNGIIGDYFRVELDRVTGGYIHSRYVERLPEGTVRPGYFVQAVTSSPSAKADIINIPFPEPVPYAVFPDPENKRIRISLFGVQSSSTWNVHKTYLKYIDRITWEQVTPETYQVILHLNTSKIWGYTLKAKGSVLEFRLNHAPDRTLADSLQPFRGLKIAIEAGHGGTSTGARGLSGMLEKDINLDLALRLEQICKRSGVEVLQVRDSDKTMSLDRKRAIIEASDAHLLVSVHANSGNTSRGYLRVAGTSTYYHNPFWAPFANLVYDRLLDLDLDEFGVVGSFNYKVTRMSSRPAILVEQAFMSHAEDEEKLYSEEFRQAMAEKIFEGIIDYLQYMYRE